MSQAVICFNETKQSDFRRHRSEKDVCLQKTQIITNQTPTTAPPPPKKKQESFSSFTSSAGIDDYPAPNKMENQPFHYFQIKLAFAQFFFNSYTPSDHFTALTLPLTLQGKDSPAETTQPTLRCPIYNRPFKFKLALGGHVGNTTLPIGAVGGLKLANQGQEAHSSLQRSAASVVLLKNACRLMTISPPPPPPSGITLQTGYFMHIKFCLYPSSTSPFFPPVICEFLFGTNALSSSFFVFMSGERQKVGVLENDFGKKKLLSHQLRRSCFLYK